jgi:hypothetical protein
MINVYMYSEDHAWGQRSLKRSLENERGMAEKYSCNVANAFSKVACVRWVMYSSRPENNEDNR